MLIATVQRCPFSAARWQASTRRKAKAVKGVRHVVQISSGVAVVADSYWAAQKRREALKITWDEGPNAQLSSAEITRSTPRPRNSPDRRRVRKAMPPSALGGGHDR